MSEETQKDTKAGAGQREAGGNPEEVLRPHEYDGIQEYDNPPPFWLQGLFIATVFFAIAYIPYYILGYALEFDSPTVRVEQEMKELEQTRLAQQKAMPQVAVSEETLAALLQKPDAVQAGKTAYATTCAACHGPEGQGLIGPNLTDNAWLHGGRLTDIRKTIADGVPAKGMMAWGAQLKPETIDALVAYIRSIQGTNPPNAKPPQGELAAVTH